MFVDGAARQGLPTSPAVANLAAVAMDRAILKMIDKRKWQVVFTRYADDLGFSFDDPAIAEPLREAVYSVVRRCGFTPNLEKTKLMDANEGRQILTGIGIDHAGIHPTRKAKRKLRAAIHQGNEHSARGLSEWCKLKPPRERVYQAKEDELTSLSKAWNISLACLKNAPDKGPDEVVSCESGDVIITGDPIYMLGMSTWTTGWVSCMKQPSGSHRKGVLFWSLLRGTRLATLLSNSTMTVAGVTRRVMRARALVHTMRDGTIWGDRIYGNDGDKEILEKALAGRGIVHVSRAPRGLKVEGHVDARKKPYFDNLKSSVSTATNGQWKGRKVIVVHT